MKYAIIELHGKQYILNENLHLKLSRILTNVGNLVLINKILVLRNCKQIYIGQPYVTCFPFLILLRRLVNISGRKILIFKLKSKKKYRKKIGIKDFNYIYNPLFY